jgi:hypothetical protein
MNAVSIRPVACALAGAALLVWGATSAQAQSNGVYKPLPGKCRVANSFGGAGPLVAGVDRNINVTNAASYSTQGGTGSVSGGNSSTGCGIPSSVTALVISTSVVPRGSAGTLKVFEAGKSLADGNSVAFNAVDAVTNDMIVPARSTDTTAEITLNSSRATDYILDVVGYFVPAALQCTDLFSNDVGVAGGSSAQAAAPACAAGYLSMSTGCHSLDNNVYFTKFTQGICTGKNLSSVASSFYAIHRCCRLSP